MANESTELTIVKDGGYQYNLMELPPQDSPGIIKEGKEILRDMQIESIIQNLENVARLMFVAYNALGGTMVQSKMSGLQKKYLELIDDSEQAIITFEDRSQEICAFVARAYGWLLKGKEKMALSQFERCAEAAEEMALKAETLAGGFKELGGQAEQVLESTQDESTLQYKKMDEIQKQMEQYNANLAGLKSMQEELDKNVEDINKIYQEAKKKENAAFELKKGMEIANAVAGCLKAIIPSVSSMQGNMSQESSRIIQGIQEKLSSQEKEKTELASKRKAAEQELKRLQQEQEELEKEIADIRQQIEAKESNTVQTEEEKEEALKGLRSELGDREEKLNEKKEKISQEETVLKEAEKQLTQLEDGIDKLNQQLNECVQQCKDDYARAEEAAERALEKKLEMEKQRRETLASIQEFTVLIQSGVRQKNVAETAVKTLQVAIQCIKQVVVALLTAAKFWNSMKDYCKNLAKSQVIKDIEDMNNDENKVSMEERLEMYQDNMFKKAFFQYICRWAALYYVCDDYRRRNNKVRDMVAGNIKSSAGREEEWQLAGRLADEMKKSIDAQVEDSDKVVQSLKRGGSNE